MTTDPLPRETTFTVYGCPAHGLMEAFVMGYTYGTGDELQPVPECPVSMGQDDVCHLRLEGPFTVSMAEENDHG